MQSFWSRHEIFDHFLLHQKSSLLIKSINSRRSNDELTRDWIEEKLSHIRTLKISTSITQIIFRVIGYNISRFPSQHSVRLSSTASTTWRVIQLQLGNDNESAMSWCFNIKIITHFPSFSRTFLSTINISRLSGLRCRRSIRASPEIDEEKKKKRFKIVAVTSSSTRLRRFFCATSHSAAHSSWKRTRIIFPFYSFREENDLLIYLNKHINL